MTVTDFSFTTCLEPDLVRVLLGHTPLHGIYQVYRLNGALEI